MEKFLKGLGAAAAIATILTLLIVIAQWAGIISLQDIFAHPKPTPSPTPIIAESIYDSASPGCDASKDPSDIVWQITSANNTCQSNDGGTVLTQTDLKYVPELLFEATGGKTLASNHTISAQFSNVGSNTCAGIATRQNKENNAGYAFYFCGDGNWYILEYTSQGGTPVVLNQSTSNTQGNPTDNYTLVITMENNNLQMTVNGQTYTAQNSDFTLTEEAGIVMSEESVVTTYQSAQTAVSITVSNFHYQAV